MVSMFDIFVVAVGFFFFLVLIYFCSFKGDKEQSWVGGVGKELEDWNLGTK